MPEKHTPYPRLPFGQWTGDNRRIESLSIGELERQHLVMGMPLKPGTGDVQEDLAKKGVVGLFRAPS
jgi:hypothetical protein